MKTILKSKTIFLLLFIFYPVLITAQKKDSISTAAKIDSIYNLQKKIYKEVKDDPLKNKTFGIEFNFVRLLLVDKMSSVSGGLSLFSIDRGAEISFPFYYQFPKTSTDLTDITLDCHYRFFLGKAQKGFYLSAFVRYAYLHGALGDDYLFNTSSSNGIGTENKLGVGFGLGFRVFSHKTFYWGTSLNLGRYIIGTSNKFASSILSVDDDNEFIFDIELLKFGFSF